MNVEIEAASEATSDLVDSLNRLVPQLSSSAAPLTLNDVASMVGSDVVTLYVARHEGRVVGTLTLAVFAIPTGWRAWIEDVVVDETARGLGVGEQLTMAAVDEARRRGVRSIDLTSRPRREAANALYQKLGFERRETNVYRYFIDDVEGDRLTS
jgi:ribosomal protein S18 acetylase RimI-like enzyme